MRDSWRKYLFKNVIKSTQLGTNLIGNEKNTGIPLLKMGNLTIGGFSFNKLEKIEYSKSYEAEKFILKKGDFLFNTRNTLELVGKSAVWNNNLSEAIFNSNIMRIKFEEDKADDFFLGYYFSQGKGWNEFKRISTGTTSVAAIYSRDLFECEIKIPPLAQQRKIAEILSTVDAVLEKTEAAIAKYQQLKQGLMHDVFTRGIDIHTGQLRPKQTEAPELYKQSALGWIPKEWEVEELGTYISLLKSGLSRLLSHQDIGLPVLISGNIQNEKLDLSNLKYWYKNDPQGANTENYFLEKGDILLCFINSMDQIGKLAYFEGYTRDCIYTTNLFRIKSSDSENSKFLYYLLSSRIVQSEIKSIVKPAVNQASFTTKDFIKINVPLINSTEQTQIAQTLQSIDQKIHTEQQALAKYQQLKAGLLQDLLTGRVEVRV